MEHSIPLQDVLNLNKIAYRLQYGGGHKKQAIARAAGTSYNKELTVVDATCGLGTDTFVLAYLNCKVLAIERNIKIAKLFATRIAAAANNPILAKAARNIVLFTGDSRQIVDEILEKYNITPDVIYLDPMFKHKTSAAPNKLIQNIQQILTKEQEPQSIQDDNLLNIMLQTSVKKIIVKRSRMSPYLENIKPNFSIPGKANRFDIYLKTQ